MDNKFKEVSKNTKVVTLRVPLDLKKRLERQAKFQGVSLNQMANYLLSMELTQLETIMNLEEKLSSKNISSLKTRVRRILSNIPGRAVPEWDRF